MKLKLISPIPPDNLRHWNGYWQAMFDASSNDATERLIAVLKEAYQWLAFVDTDTNPCKRRIEALLKDLE